MRKKGQAKSLVHFSRMGIARFVSRWLVKGTTLGPSKRQAPATSYQTQHLGNDLISKTCRRPETIHHKSRNRCGQCRRKHIKVVDCIIQGIGKETDRHPSSTIPRDLNAPPAGKRHSLRVSATARLRTIVSHTNTGSDRRLQDYYSGAIQGLMFCPSFAIR